MKVHFSYEALDSQEQRVARFLGRSYQPLTMAGLRDPPVLVPTICTYRAYFSSPETDPFYGDYEAVLESYLIDPMNAAAAKKPASLSQQIYAASQQGEPTDFLLWHATPGLAKDCDPGRVLLLHSVIYYASRVGRPSSKWDDRTFTNRGDVSYGTATPLTFTSPRPSTCRAPPLYTTILLATPMSHSWDHGGCQSKFS